MAVTGVGDLLMGGATAGAGTAAKKSTLTGKDDFLKLMVAQMKNQNPLEPLKDGEFLAQLAQFSSLEGTQQLNKSMSEMLLLQQMTQGANLIGKTVTYEKTSGSLPAKGLVQGVNLDNNSFSLVVDGKTVSLAQVRGIEATK